MSVYGIEIRCDVGGCGELIGRTFFDDDWFGDDGWEGVGPLEVLFACPVHSQVKLPSRVADRDDAGSVVTETRCGMGDCGRLVARGRLYADGTWYLEKGKLGHVNDADDREFWVCPVHGEVAVPESEEGHGPHQLKYDRKTVVLAYRADRQSKVPRTSKRRAKVASEKTTVSRAIEAP